MVIGSPVRRTQKRADMTSQRTKRWAVNVVSNGQLPLTLFCDGRPVTQTTPATLDDISPVEYLLIALASCFALSCRTVLADTKRPRISFEVVATGEKAPSAENLLTNISIVGIFRSGISESDAALITAQARPLCTVNNSVLEAATIQYSSRSIREFPGEVRGSVPRQTAH
jgi:uncharacterized OsmC-like protein